MILSAPPSSTSSISDTGGARRKEHLLPKAARISRLDSSNVNGKAAGQQTMTSQRWLPSIAPVTRASRSFRILGPPVGHSFAQADQCRTFRPQQIGICCARFPGCRLGIQTLKMERYSVNPDISTSLMSMAQLKFSTLVIERNI